MSQNANQPKREPINRYRPLTQGEARALGGGLMRVPTKEEANKGDYVEYSEYQQLAADHAALVQQGIRDHADWRSKLNFLEADYKAEIARLRAEKEAETRATFDAIRTITQLRDDYAALAAENERLRSKLSFSQSISEICNQPHEGETITVKGAISSGKTDLSSLCQCERLAAENERLRKAGDAMAELMQAEENEAWKYIGTGGKPPLRLCVKKWLAAKEGSDAK